MLTQSTSVFANQEAYDAEQSLTPGSVIGALGPSEKDALIVQVSQRALLPHHPVGLGVRGNVDRVGVLFASRELNHLLAKDTAKYNRLESPGLTRDETLQIRAGARAAIKSFTRQAIEIRDGVLLDGPLNLGQGQAKSAFYYAYSRFGGVLAAKVNGARYRRDFQREVAVNLALGSHKNIVQFVKSFSIANADNEQRHVIVMPFFARSAADLLAQHSPVEPRALATIARDCVSALCHIHSKNYCFADLKPANIMLQCGERGGATLVDFGAAVKLGDLIVEATDEFCLDVAIVQGSKLVDWTCLGTTLAQLAGIDITQFYSRQDLVMFLNDEDHSVDERVQQLIISCLVEPCRSRIEAALAALHDAFCSVSVQAPQGC
jgi:serine/threonine protein kinase